MSDCMSAGWIYGINDCLVGNMIFNFKMFYYLLLSDEFRDICYTERIMDVEIA